MVSRRDFIRTGLGYTIVPLLANRGPVTSVDRTTSRNARYGDPLARATGLNEIVWEGPPSGSGLPDTKLPFYSTLLGDAFPQFGHTVLLNTESPFLGPDGKPPRPDEFVDVAVIGGGLAGLTAAYALRDHKPVVFEYADRFGGNSKGETWRDTQYSMGGAYLIDPDPGPILDTLSELGLESVLRAYSGNDAIEAGGKILPKFFEGQGSPKADAVKFEQYRSRLEQYAFEDYPELPTADGTISPTVQDLDKRSLKAEIESWVDGKFPTLLADAIQLYCYSSFNAGWEEISAAAGLNFLAAEEYDLWVYPGGLGQVSRRLWKHTSIATGAKNMRTGKLVFDVRLVKNGVQITYIDSTKKVRSMVARAAVVACPKKFYQWMDRSIDMQRLNTIRELKYRSYCVANVLIKGQVPGDLYDLFLIQDGVSDSSSEAEDQHRITDALSARWVTTKPAKESVLTCYWPMPFDPAALHFTFGPWTGEAEMNFRQQAAGSVLKILDVLDVAAANVQQIRLTRWAHAMPVSPIGFYNAGKHNILREPIGDRIFFANQDNWALPAIETSMLEAFRYVPEVEAAIAG